MTKYAAIIYDLDGTIVDTETIWDECSVEFLGRHGHVYDKQATKHLTMGGTLEGGAAILRDHHGFTGDAAALAQERREIFAELLQRDVQFIPGFLDFHAKVRTTHKTAIGTSMERPFIASVERRLQLTQYFGEHIYSIADIGFIPKPHPDIFLYAAKQLGVDPATCLVIEDAPKGVQAAKAAGMACAALTTSTSHARLAEAGADQVVNHYSHILL